MPPCIFRTRVSGLFRIFGPVKESKFVKTKIVAGYLLLIAVCILSVGYVYRVAVRFSAPDRSYALLHTKRSAVNRTLYHLYQAESYGQLMIAGYASYEARYRRELRTVRASIDSLRALTVGGDSLQTMRLDSITRLIADKERRTVSLRRSIRAGATAGLLDKNIRSLIGPREAVVADTIPFRSIVRQDTTAVPRAKRRFFQRLGDLFSPPGGRFEPRDLAPRDHRPGHPRRRGEGHHRAGAASLAGQRHEQPAGHLRPCVAGGAAVELQQRTGQYEDIPPDHGLRGRGHGLPDAAYRA